MYWEDNWGREREVQETETEGHKSGKGISRHACPQGSHLSSDLCWLTLPFATSAQVRTNQSCWLDHTSRCQTCFCGQEGGSSSSPCPAGCIEHRGINVSVLTLCLTHHFLKLPRIFSQLCHLLVKGLPKQELTSMHLIALTNFSSMNLSDDLLGHVKHVQLQHPVAKKYQVLNHQIYKSMLNFQASKVKPP